ncbi:MAG TPA: ATP-grasp domain-containing protein [Steroidobacter sp.]|uniref:carboxylate--amine ligase n=1 Tax=Steroidobacter sp. TaxID=1978227 RepID=UPI002ED7FCD6
MTTLRVLITDADNRSALAATRSLGARGHKVIIAAERHPALASVSRYASAVESCPSPSADPQGFVAAIVQIAARQRIDVLLPMTEITTLLLTEHQHLLPEHCRLPFPPMECVARASNKAYVVQTAHELGVPIPATHIVDSGAEAVSLAETLTFPAVIKPARSRVRTASGWISTAVSYAATREIYEHKVQNLRPEEYPVLIQERIQGPGVGVFACFDRGKPVAWFTHRRIREKPPSGGVSVLRESAPLDPAAVEHATKLLTHLGWHGVAMVEFKRDDRDGSLRLMEINGRFWGSLQLAIDAGVDFPSLLVELAAGRHPAPIQSYRVGVRSRWFWGDVDSLLTVMLRSRASLNLPPNHPGRLRTLWNFLKFGGKHQRDEILRLNDARPWLLETRRWFIGR